MCQSKKDKRKEVRNALQGRIRRSKIIKAKIICCAREDGIALKKRTEKAGHLVSCLGVRSQRVNGNPMRYERGGGYRRFRCNRRSACEPGCGCRSDGDRPTPV